MIFIITFLMLNLSVSAEVITGAVEYSESLAQQEMIETTPECVDLTFINNNLIDANRIANFLNILKGSTDLKDRTLAAFSDGSYGVIYKDNPKYVWYYNNNGALMHSEVKTSLNYPYKTYKYTPAGKLVNMSLRVSKSESYVFTNNGELIAHWIGKNCYDKDKKIIMTRNVLE